MSETPAELPAPPITAEDLAPFVSVSADKASAIIALVWPLAVRAAPCITDPDFRYPEALRSVLIAICLRVAEQGTGGLTQRTQTAPGFSVNESIDTRPTSRTNLLWPSEIKELQELCKANSGDQDGGAFSVDTAPCTGLNHSPICSLVFGATYCSCGADLTQDGPLYEQVEVD